VVAVAGDGQYRFKATGFVSPAKHQPAALEWRVGRIGQAGWYELAEHWVKESGLETTMAIAAEVFSKPGEYRVRARWRDGTGRCGPWSEGVAVRVMP
jgi:hypothetical protein